MARPDRRPVPAARALALAAAGLIAASPATGAAVWLAGVDPVVRPHMAGAGPGDFEQLFQARAPWERAAKSVAVFKVSTQYLRSAPDAALGQMIGELKRRGIAMGFEALMMPKPGGCGAGVEGYSSPGDILAVAQRVKRLGGVLAYAAMDEPLSFGHVYQGPQACRAAVSDVAAGLAANVRALRQVFPDIRIGDIEPFSGPAAKGATVADILAFAAAYRTATGTPLAFFDADIDWSRLGDDDLAPLKAALHAAGIRFGVIFNGDPDDATDIAWTRHAEARFEAVEQRSDTAPDDAILQTWMVHPTHMLPESQPGTMTGLVLRYARPVTRLSLHRQGDALVGRLGDASGAPVAGAPITLWTREDSADRKITGRTLEGVVPAGAVRAIVALRINTESDGVGGGAITLGLSRYREGGGPITERDLLAGPVGDRRLTVTTGQVVARGAAPFAVTAGRPFTLETPFAASSGLGDAGYVALIFLGVDGREIHRVKIALTPGRQPSGQAITDSGGRFQIGRPTAGGKGAVIEAVYAGDGRLRGATAALR